MRSIAADTSFALGNHAGSGPRAAGGVAEIGDRRRPIEPSKERQHMERKEYLLSEMSVELRRTAVRAGKIPAVSVGITIRL